METIALKRKNVIPVEINGKECVAVLDNYTIDYFQRTNKIGLLKFYESVKEMEKTGNIEVTPILKLLGAILRDKKTNNILGVKFLTQYDTFEVIEMLTPILHSVFKDNMPQAKNEKEKK